MSCDMCGHEVKEEECVFAIEKRIIDGEEHTFCCSCAAERFEKEKE